MRVCINPFPTNVSIMYPLKTSENPQFSDVFRGYRSGTLVKNGLNQGFLTFQALENITSLNLCFL